MKKIAKLIAISLCLATTTFAMEDASFVEEVDYDGRAVLFNLKSALEVIQVVTPEALQRLVNKKQSNSGLVDHCSALCETLLAIINSKIMKKKFLIETSMPIGFFGIPG